MIQKKEVRKKRIWVLCVLLVLMGELMVLLYYGGQKTGFHEDELYTFYSSNKTAGLFVEDRQWVPGDQLFSEMVVLKGETFRFWVVKQMQSFDVHPPLYYYFYHAAASLTPGVFSKWTGIAVNLVAFIGCFLLLSGISYEVYRKKEGFDKRAAALTLCVDIAWGLSAAVISGVMFIRMYQWLTFFVLLITWIHVKAIRKNVFSFIRFYLPVTITVFLGFLTQYYYLIFHVFLGIGFCLYVLFKQEKPFFKILMYGLSCAVGLAGALLYYPASLSHIFRGYRGTEAVSEFKNGANTLDRFRFFIGLFDDYVVNDTLVIWLLILLLLALSACYIYKKNGIKITYDLYGILGITALGYFAIIAKTALILGETSNRYELPIYGIILLLLIGGMANFADVILAQISWTKNWEKIVLPLSFCAILLLMNGLNLKEGRVFFLYKEEQLVKQYIEEKKDEPVTVIYNPESSDAMWWLLDELSVFDRIYMVDSANLAKTEDDVLRNADYITVYLADGVNPDAVLGEFLDLNSAITKYDVVMKKDLWTIYAFS